MTIPEIAKLLNAKILCCEHMQDYCIENAFGADMMSDVLAFVKPQTLVLTGLVNPHVIRTCSMLDVHCVIFVRGKMPTEEIIEEACDCDLLLMTTECTLYQSCGILFNAGLPPVQRS